MKIYAMLKLENTSSGKSLNLYLPPWRYISEYG